MNKVYRAIGVIILLLLIIFGIYKFFYMKNSKEVSGSNTNQIGMKIIDEKNKSGVSLNKSVILKEGIISQPIFPDRVPASAIIWWDGQAWVYSEQSSQEYIRSEIFILAFDNGYYEVSGLPSNFRTVTEGAQLLLSMEKGQSESSTKAEDED